MLERTAIYTTNQSINGATSEEWDFHGEDTQEHLHSLHPYPARFIPQIPRKAILKWSEEGDVVYDPFCGCGTTLLEGMLLNRTTFGVDNNAVACLISRAKTTTYTKKDLEELEGLIRFVKQLLNPDFQCESLVPEYKSINYWFDEKAIIDLGKIRWSINRLTTGNANLLAMAILSSIIVRVSYQDSDTRYSRKITEYQDKSAISSFLTKLKGTIKKVLEVNERISLTKSRSTVFLGDTKETSFIENDSVNLIITSPPYLNAYDYHKYHRHRLHWIDGDVAFARDNEIGKHDDFTRKNATPDQYFDDMEKCFIEWYRVLTVGGRVLIVIGDAIVNKSSVAVGDRFVELFINCGFILEDRWIRKLQTTKKSFNQSARMDKEHLLLFRK